MNGSYSIHISSRQHAIKNKKQLVSFYKHILRLYQEKKGTYDKDKIIELIENPCKSANDYVKVFNKSFSNELLEYNNKQKRDDRKIDDYFKHVESSDKDIAVEIIIQISDKYYWDENPDKRKFMEDVYREQIKDLQEMFPNLIITNAMLHLDEASPHIHILGIPKATDYKRGLLAQCAKSKVFTPEILEKTQEEMREKALNSMRKFADPDFTFKKKEKGRNFDYSKEKIIELKTGNDRRNQLNNDLTADIQENFNEIDEISRQIEKFRKNFFYRIFHNLPDLRDKLDKKEKKLISNIDWLVQNHLKNLSRNFSSMDEFLEGFPVIDFEGIRKSAERDFYRETYLEFKQSKKDDLISELAEKEKTKKSNIEKAVDLAVKELARTPEIYNKVVEIKKKEIENNPGELENLMKEVENQLFQLYSDLIRNSDKDFFKKRRSQIRNEVVLELKDEIKKTVDTSEFRKQAIDEYRKSELERDLSETEKAGINKEILKIKVNEALENPSNEIIEKVNQEVKERLVEMKFDEKINSMDYEIDVNNAIEEGIKASAKKNLAAGSLMADKIIKVAHEAINRYTDISNSDKIIKEVLFEGQVKPALEIVSMGCGIEDMAKSDPKIFRDVIARIKEKIQGVADYLGVEVVFRGRDVQKYKHTQPVKIKEKSIIKE
ncbi:plasmid recombination protein [Leptotrichia wadei]|uniref:Plasmid recombination enzyme n=1 Tax=Leptotrichia wadei (strain F0279) TaxID=888055 RepID=U2Q215_LEPWF|nr:plasmid recombination protein [Leptotrichia wadei]ERK50054.1 plasmid recombination enzyme [Leptotrichia wadei F0279]